MVLTALQKGVKSQQEVSGHGLLSDPTSAHWIKSGAGSMFMLRIAWSPHLK